MHEKLRQAIDVSLAQSRRVNVTRKSDIDRDNVGRRFAPGPDRSALAVRKTADPLDSYDDRAGYNEDFIGPGSRRVALPELGHLAPLACVAGVAILEE